MNKKNATQPKPERKSLEIQFWLRKRGTSQNDIADEIKRDKAMVSRTINGKGNSRRVLDHLKALGVPTKYLGIEK